MITVRNMLKTDHHQIQSALLYI